MIICIFILDKFIWICLFRSQFYSLIDWIEKIQFHLVNSKNTIWLSLWFILNTEEHSLTFLIWAARKTDNLFGWIISHPDYEWNEWKIEVWKILAKTYINSLWQGIYFTSVFKQLFDNANVFATNQNWYIDQLQHHLYYECILNS